MRPLFHHLSPRNQGCSPPPTHGARYLQEALSGQTGSGQWTMDGHTSRAMAEDQCPGCRPPRCAVLGASCAETASPLRGIALQRDASSLSLTSRPGSKLFSWGRGTSHYNLAGMLVGTRPTALLGVEAVVLEQRGPMRADVTCRPSSSGGSELEALKASAAGRPGSGPGGDPRGRAQAPLRGVGP